MKLFLSALFVCAAAFAEPGGFQNGNNPGGGQPGVGPNGPAYYPNNANQGGYYQGGYNPPPGGYAYGPPGMVPPAGAMGGMYLAPGIYHSGVKAGGGSFGIFGGSQWQMSQSRTLIVRPPPPMPVPFCYPPYYGPWVRPMPMQCGAPFPMPH